MVVPRADLVWNRWRAIHFPKWGRRKKNYMGQGQGSREGWAKFQHSLLTDTPAQVLIYEIFMQKL